MVSIAAGVVTFGSCALATGGLGSPLCAAAAGAVSGAVNAAFDCPGRSRGECLKGLAVAGVSGGVAVAIGGLGLTGGLIRNVVAGFGAGVTHSALSQGLTTGRVDLGAAVQEGVFGAGIVVGLHGVATGLQGLRRAMRGSRALASVAERRPLARRTSPEGGESPFATSPAGSGQRRGLRTVAGGAAGEPSGRPVLFGRPASNQCELRRGKEFRAI